MPIGRLALSTLLAGSGTLGIADLAAVGRRDCPTAPRQWVEGEVAPKPTGDAITGLRPVAGLASSLASRFTA